MVTVKIFGKQNCDLCKKVKEKFDVFLAHWEKKDGVNITFYDLDTPEGLVEGAMLNATDVPTTIIEKDGSEVARWEKKSPVSQEFRGFFE
ncbi:MAG: hypothetical protein ABH857_03690 [Elusimicrobiota bacterium]